MSDGSKILIVKRNGKKEEFNAEKIKNAILKCFEATKTDKGLIENIMFDINSDIKTKSEQSGEITVEQVQDIVEDTLIDYDLKDAVKSYILYRNQHTKVRNMNNTLLDYKKLVDGYIKKDDWRVKENASMEYSLGGFILANSGAVTANYWLDELFDKEVADAHRNGDMHIHDLGMLAPYCCGNNLLQLIKEGLHGVKDKTSSAPAKHLSTLVNQMVNFTGILQNEAAG